ncbi:hypothetical protein M1N23_00190, partial [Dehalococcoidia bacterium]|nr:hypothetical protein [Dehalococcoidia bacterium]
MTNSLEWWTINRRIYKILKSVSHSTVETVLEVDDTSLRSYVRMANFIGIRWIVTTSLAVMLAMFLAACTTTETIEVKGAPVIVEKEVVKEVIVQGETTVVEKVITETVEVKGETIVKEVVKEVAVPGAAVVVEKVVEKEVIKEVKVEVPVLVEKEVVKIVEIPGKEYVTDPTNGKVYTAPQYGGQINAALDRVPPNADQSVGGL